MLRFCICSSNPEPLNISPIFSHLPTSGQKVVISLQWSDHLLKVTDTLVFLIQSGKTPACHKKSDEGYMELCPLLVGLELNCKIVKIQTKFQGLEKVWYGQLYEHLVQCPQLLVSGHPNCSLGETDQIWHHVLMNSVLSLDAPDASSSRQLCSL